MIVTVTLLVIVFAVCADWLRRRAAIFRTFQENGIPGPKPHILYGNLHEFIESRSDGEKATLLTAKTNWLKEYGDVVGYYSGVVERIIVKDLDMLKQIFIKDANIFIDRPMFDPTDNGILSVNGQKWKDMRKIMTPVFSASKMKKMLPLMQECMTTFVDILQEKAKKQEEFDIYEVIQCATMDVIDRCALDLDWQCLRNPKKPELGEIRKFISIPSGLLRTMRMLPSLGKVMGILFKLGASQNKNIQKDIEGKVLKKIVERRNGTKVYCDALQLLMDASEDNEGRPAQLTEDEVASNAFVFIVAGYETTSNALAYAFHLLSLNQDIQEQARQEVLDIVGETETPNYEHLNKLVYTEAVLMETMRLFPPITGFMSRVATSDWTYEKYTVKKGQTVEVPVWTIHHDPEIYPDPEVFNPDRFLPAERSSRHPMAWIPFGAGPRNCIGLRFAMMEAKLCLAMLLQKHVIKPCSKTQVPLVTRTPSLLTNPADGVWVKMESRD